MESFEIVFGVDIDHSSVPAKYFETQCRVIPFQGRNIHISVIAAFSVDTAEIDFVLFLSATSSACALMLTSVRSLGIVKIQQFICSCQPSAYRVSEDWTTTSTYSDWVILCGKKFFEKFQQSSTVKVSPFNFLLHAYQSKVIDWNWKDSGDWSPIGVAWFSRNRS